MLNDIVFSSADEFRLLKPTAAVVVVSILSRQEAARRPQLAGFHDAIALEFEDTSEEVKLAEPGSWPDEPSDAEHAVFAQGRGERIPALSDAIQIVEFLNRQHRNDESLTLVVHCQQGTSRSAAVAHWAAQHYSAPISRKFGTQNANRRLLRLLVKAGATRPATMN